MTLENRDMEDHKALGDYAIPSVSDGKTRIQRPAIVANTFEIKAAIVQVVQNQRHLVEMSVLQVFSRSVVRLRAMVCPMMRFDLGCFHSAYEIKHRLVIFSYARFNYDVE
ncbi:hypothetical protein MLD38_005157 [Melastoma candidum]|uniref:Uncharacterized protein n=1 Tax=Melastoma candidum TaxID=119954 RepID=A0ACB9S7H4_9MYRT|nr:hypothetical protein MLD38_005157 [Melastoma candidum]